MSWPSKYVLTSNDHKSWDKRTMVIVLLYMDIYVKGLLEIADLKNHYDHYDWLTNDLRSWNILDPEVTQ